MNRTTLDVFTRHHRLAAPAVDAALALSGARPDAAAWRRFGATLLRAAGLGALGAGVLFFVAANWQDYGVFGRFALLQAALLVSVVAAFWRPPPALVGQAGLFLATLLTGGLLALFGQSYQTGADVHELFFAWALLALPFALAGLSGAIWAVWWTVLNVGLALLCGWMGPQHAVWRFIGSRHLDHAMLLMLPCLVNLGAAAGFLGLHRSRWASAAPAWLPRGLLSVAFLYGTAAAIEVVAVGNSYRNPGSDSSGGDAAVVLLFTALSIGLAVATWRRRQDVFPMALIAAWLVGASTASGLLLRHLVRTWRAPPTPIATGAAA